MGSLIDICHNQGQSHHLDLLVPQKSLVEVSEMHYCSGRIAVAKTWLCLLAPVSAKVLIEMSRAR